MSAKKSGWALGLALAVCVPLAPLIGALLGISVLREKSPGAPGAGTRRGLAIAAVVIGSLAFLPQLIVGVVFAFGPYLVDDEEQSADEAPAEVVPTSGVLTRGEVVLGTCLELKSKRSGAVDHVARPCSKPHEYEAIDLIDLKGTAYPTITDKTMNAGCAPGFESYVGTTLAKSRLRISITYPSTAAWDAGERRVVCLVYDPKGKSVGSWRDSGE